MKRVIWVDDDIRLIRSMRNMFLDYGFMIDSCTNLTDAHKKLKRGYTSNLLIDVEFPNSNKEGIVFLENIIEDFPDLNAVIYTGYPETDDAVKVVKQKLAADYIRKDSLLDKYKRDLFFARLHENFVDIREPSRLIREFQSIDEFETYELRKWRRQTILQLLISLFVLGLSLLWVYYKNDFKTDDVFIFFEKEKLWALILTISYTLINVFIVKDLYHKYRNHSNINNYINRVIAKKIPSYLKKQKNQPEHSLTHRRTHNRTHAGLKARAIAANVCLKTIKSMYRIDKTTNNVIKLEQRLFKDLRIREREHLQEWIAKNPDILGEELLIIQKEYDGFNDTNERLDLLALDKEGGLVIIENKLDDSGRNVVWQALKYASYCSTLTTAQIINIYQQYLDKWGQNENARENLLEFLEGDEEDLLLNRNDQRIVFVANHFRKEVTSTVLWLLDHDVHIQCFRATPYSMGEQLFLQVAQIIPLPETQEFMIDAKEKEKEEKDKSKTVEASKARLVRFWSALKEDLVAHQLNFLDNVSAKPYYDIGFLKGNGRFGFCIGRKGFRVELYFSNDPDKVYLDAMAKHTDQLKATLGDELVWERLEGKKASRIKYEIPYTEFEGSFSTEQSWPEQIKWYREAMVKFYTAIYPILEDVQKEIVQDAPIRTGPRRQ